MKDTSMDVLVSSPKLGTIRWFSNSDCNTHDLILKYYGHLNADTPDKPNDVKFNKN